MTDSVFNLPLFCQKKRHGTEKIQIGSAKSVRNKKVGENNTVPLIVHRNGTLSEGKRRKVKFVFTTHPDLYLSLCLGKETTHLVLRPGGIGLRPTLMVYKEPHSTLVLNCWILNSQSSSPCKDLSIIMT